MTWTVTLHPALTGDVTSTSSDPVAFIADLLRLERDGGLTSPAADFPASLPSDIYLKWRCLRLPSETLIIFSGSWLQHECCILGVAPADLSDDNEAYALWGQTILQRYQRIYRKDVETLGLSRFLDMFTENEVAAAETIVLNEYRQAQRREIIRCAVDDLENTLSDLLGLDKRQRRRLVSRMDFMLQHLRSNLQKIDAELYIGIRFKEDHFEFKRFEDLPRTGH